MRRIVTSSICLLLSFGVMFQALGQQQIKTELQLTADVAQPFNDEWLYLTTELYLFNVNQYGKLLYEIGHPQPSAKNKKSGKFQFPESLLITAELQDLEILGGKQVVFPIYFFQVGDEAEQYSIQAETKDVVRLLDKVPLASQTQFIDATLRTEALTKANEEKLFSLVSGQLLGLSTLVNPTRAVMGLVGEYGNLLDSKSQKRQFTFKSTIRLYERPKFDTRLHSVRVYVMLPANKAVKPLEAPALQAYIDTSKSPAIDRARLAALIPYTEYPYFVVVNYKSLYTLEPVVGDQVDEDYVKTYESRIANTPGLSGEVLRQEQHFIAFLKAFADLKASIRLYRQTLEKNNFDGLEKLLFGAMRSYRALLQSYNTRLLQDAGNSTFKTVFRPQYDAILTNADLYLEADNNLKSGKDVVRAILELEDKNAEKLDSASRESYMRRLQAVKLPDIAYLQGYPEGQMITREHAALESAHYKLHFQPRVEQLGKVAANAASQLQAELLKSSVSATYCASCRENVIQAVEQFGVRYDQFQLQQLIEMKEALVRSAEDSLLVYLGKLDCINKNVGSQTDSTSALMQRVLANVAQLKSETSALNDLTASSTTENITSQTVKQFVDILNELLADIPRRISLICKAKPELCGC